MAYPNIDHLVGVKQTYNCPKAGSIMYCPAKFQQKCVVSFVGKQVIVCVCACMCVCVCVTTVASNTELSVDRAAHSRLLFNMTV